MKEKKDILLICQFYEPEYVTCAGLAADMCRALAKDGMSVDVLCGYPKEYVKNEDTDVPLKEISGGVSVRRLKYLAVSRRSVFGRLLNYFSFYIAAFFRLFSMRRYKVVAAYSNPPMVTNLLNFASRLFRVKTVFIAHDVYPEIAIKTGSCGEKSLMAAAMRRINRKLSKRLDGEVCISKEMTDFFESERHIPREKIATIPNWHRDLFKGSSAPRDVSKPLKVGYFGNMGVCQDMETVLKAIEEVRTEKTAQYIFAGHGSKLKEVRGRVGSFENVTVHGFLTGSDFESALGGCDVCVLSLKEGLGGLCAPSKVYSYYMMGKPVIAVTDEKDICADIEKYGCGMAVRNGDAKAFSEAVKTLAEDEALRLKMGENSRQCFLENYTKEKCCGKLTEFFKQLL